MSSTLGKSLAILDLFTPHAPVWSADGLTEKLGCSRPTGYRYVRELVATGLLQRIGAGLYSLGPRIIELDYLIRQTDPMLTRGLPILRELVADTGCEAMLAELCGDDQILTTHQEHGVERLRLTFGRGLPLPAVRGCGSKIILAHLPARRLRRIYDTHRAEIAKAKLGRSFEAFRQSLAAMKRTGYVRSTGELDPGFVGYAAPIMDRDGEVLGALIVALSERRLAIVDEARLVRLTTEAAANITDAMRRIAPRRERSAA